MNSERSASAVSRLMPIGPKVWDSEEIRLRTKFPLCVYVCMMCGYV